MNGSPLAPASDRKGDPAFYDAPALPGAGAEDPTPGGYTPRMMERLAKEVAMGHRFGKDRKAQRDLTAEKYILHIDGEGGSQWADIVGGTRVMIPPRPLGGLRVQMNMLRPIVDNSIAYHTAQPFQVTALPRQGRLARDKARIDTLFANEVIRRGNLNLVIAEALYFAFGYGMCPVHVAWRQDLSHAAYEPIYDIRGEPLYPGFIDIWAGSPWATVFNEGAKRSSFQWFSYDRIVPTQMIRDAFGVQLDGSARLPSASTFQRISRRWGDWGLDSGGTAQVGGAPGGDELSPLICREIAPGILPDWPEGRMTVVTLENTAEAPGGPHGGVGLGRPLLLHDGPLPGRRFSITNVYASMRGDDILGKPWVADMDEAQVTINQLATHELEFVRRFARPPLVTMAGALAEDSVTTEDDAIIEVTDATIAPNFLLPPVQGASLYGPAINRWMEYLFRIGGWQAASRGESKAGDPASKVALLQQADDTIHGPIHMALRASVVNIVQTAHALAREYMTVPWVVESVSGDDMQYLAKPYINATMLSEEPPEYVVTSGYGATPEQTTQKLMQYLAMTDTQGVPLLTAEEFWKKNPDQTVKTPQVGAGMQKMARCKEVNEAIIEVAESLRQQMGDMAPRFIQPALQAIMAQYMPLQDDVAQQHVEALSEITQDMTLDPIARAIAVERQKVYYQIVQQQQMAQMQQMAALQRGQ